jgi:hypothetical protein
MIPSYLSTSMKIGQLNPTRKTLENIEFICRMSRFPSFRPKKKDRVKHPAFFFCNSVIEQKSLLG